MPFKKNEAGIPGGAATAEAASPLIPEINLYDELLTFAELSPEEQVLLLARQVRSVEETVEPAPDFPGFKDAEIAAEPEPNEFRAETISQPTDAGLGFDIGDASSASPRSEPSGALEIPGSRVAEASFEVDDSKSNIKSNTKANTKANTKSNTKANMGASGSLEIPSATSAQASSEADSSTAKVEPSGSLEMPSSTTPEGSDDSADSATKPETRTSIPQLYDRSRTGPLLAGLNVVPEFVFAGDLTLGVCLSCGAESGADDLFCVSCGVFIDEIGSTPPKSSPSCGECGQIVAADEIFCPWCGAAPGV